MTQLDRIERLVERHGRVLDALLRGEGAIAMTLEDLAKQVAANTAVEASAVTLIQGLSAELAAAATDPAKVSALAAQLSASAASLAAAITANTPAAPAPAAPPGA